MSWVSRISNLFRRNHVDEELEEDLQFHLDARTRDNLSAGMNAVAAQHDASRRFGNATLAKERAHEVNIVVSIETIGRDLRYALRGLRKSPGFTFTATIMLALGMGASVAIFAFVDAALFKPLPYLDPAHLVSVFESDRHFDRAPLSYPDYLDWKRMNRSFTSINIFGGGGGLLSLSTGAVPVDSSRVSDGFFRTLGVALGLASSVGAAALMRKLLFATPAWDAATLTAVAAVLGAAAMLASYIPAIRAAYVNPVEALRAE